MLICVVVLSDETKRAMYNAGMLDLYVDEDDEVSDTKKLRFFELFI